MRSFRQKQPPELLVSKGALRNFTTFTRKHLCQGLFFNKVADSGTGVFLCILHFAFGISKNTLFKEHLWETASRGRQPPTGVPRKRNSENMQPFYTRTPIPQCDFNKVALQLY